MNDGDKLMLLFEMLGNDVSKYKFKRQLEFEEYGNTDLYKTKTLEGMLLKCRNKVDSDYYSKNPLTYTTHWQMEDRSLLNFYIKHPDIVGSITFGQLLKSDAYTEIMKESIIYDVCDAWVQEYRDFCYYRMKNIDTMFELLPEHKKYSPPFFLFKWGSLFLIVILLWIFNNPSLLNIGIISNMNEPLAYNVTYNLVGILAILSLVVYLVVASAIGKIVRDIRKDKKLKKDKVFADLDEKVQLKRLNQSTVLEKFITDYFNKEEDLIFDISLFAGPEKHMRKAVLYTRAVERRYDYMTRYYGGIKFILFLVLAAGVGLFFVFFSIYIFGG